MSFLKLFRGPQIRGRRTCDRATEVLESRVLLTTYTVDKAGDGDDGNYGTGELTLFEAITLANANPGEDTILLEALGMFFDPSNRIEQPLPVIIDDVQITTGFNFYSLHYFGGGYVFEIESSATVEISRVWETSSRILNRGDLTVRYADYGGFENEGVLNIENSYISGTKIGPGMDFEDEIGGAILHRSGSLTIVNSTISDAAVDNRGGGIYLASGTATLRNVTVTGNFAGNLGGGLYIADGANVTLHNSIVAGNSQRNAVGTDIAGATLNPASSFNIIGDASAAGGLIDGVNGNIVGNNGTGVIEITTILDPEATNNGGIGTPTHALVPGSPALDSGSLALAVDLNGDPLPYDQRGVDRFGTEFIRVSGPGVDRGAFELQVGPDMIPNDVAAFNRSTGIWQIGISNGDDFSDTRGPRWSTAVTWETFTGDVNNDGLTDLIGRQRENGNWWVAVNQGNGTFQTQSFLKWAPDAAANWQNVQVADVNGDGRDDVIGMTNGNWWGAISNGTRFVNQYLGKWQAAGWQTILSGDLNGDGNDDVFGFRPATGEWYAGLYNGSRFSFRMIETWESSVAWSNFHTGDFTGDGNTDVLAQAGSGYWYYLSLNNQLNGETTYAGRTTMAYAPNNAPIVDDFNGDGLSDLAVVNTRREVFVKLGTGSGLADPGFWGTAPANRSLVNTGDFNSDGRADLLYFTPSTGGWIALLGSENTFTPNAFGTWTGLPLSGFEEFEVGNFG